MKAAVLYQNAPIDSEPLAVAELPDPEPAAGEILVQVHCCAICRTDLHVIEGDLPAVRLPIIPGHQVVGTVASLGPGCRRFQLGDRVGIAWLRSTCGSCRFCTSHRENLRGQSRYTGYHEHGGYAELATVREEFAYPAPAGELVPVALSCVEKGGTLAMAGIYMTPVPALDYTEHLFYERDVRSVTSNTRADGEAALRRGGSDPDRARGDDLSV